MEFHWLQLLRFDSLPLTITLCFLPVKIFSNPVLTTLLRIYIFSICELNANKRLYQIPSCSHNMFSSSTTWDRSTTHPKFDPTGVRTHDLQLMTVIFMSTETPSLTTRPSVTSHVNVISAIQNLDCRSSSI